MIVCIANNAIPNLMPEPTRNYDIPPADVARRAGWQQNFISLMRAVVRDA